MASTPEILGTSCVVKLTNTVVEKAVINGIDTFKLLEANYSQINELDSTMSFSEVSADFIVEPIMEILSTKITVNSMNVEEVNVNDYPLINSSGHSMSYFKLITHHSLYPPYGSPQWTPYDAEQPFYGNLMSYNIAEVGTVDPPSSSGPGPQ